MKKVVIVTGGGSGIGRATALAFHAADYNVVLAGRRLDALKETAAQGQGGGRFLCIATDVTDGASVRALFDGAVAEFGRVDVLFNNAGLALPPIPLDEVPVADLRAVIDVNLIGSILCAREATRVMKAQDPQGGRIINNGSLSAYSPRPGSAAYVTSKHAIVGLTKSILLDGRKTNIVASQIDVGNAVSDMSDYMSAGALQADGEYRPEPRVDVAHIANMVVYVAGMPPEANVPFVTVMATHMPFYGRG